MTLPSSSIQVANARVLNPLDPNPDDIHIEDIAHALSLQCRFSGHIKEFYSVADHVVRCSHIVPAEEAFNALNHDDSEYILVDIPSPIKNDLFGQQYRDTENRIMTIIAKKFGFTWPMSDWVKWADNTLLATERRDLLDPLPPDQEQALWNSWLLNNPLPEKIEPLTPKEARDAFLNRFYELGGKDA